MLTKEQIKERLPERLRKYPQPEPFDADTRLDDINFIHAHTYALLCEVQELAGLALEIAIKEHSRPLPEILHPNS